MALGEGYPAQVSKIITVNPNAGEEFYLRTGYANPREGIFQIRLRQDKAIQVSWTAGRQASFAQTVRSRRTSCHWPEQDRGDPCGVPMQSKIRWLAFWDVFPWIIVGIMGWCIVTSTSIAIVLTVGNIPKWLQICVVVLTQVLFGVLLFLRGHRGRRRRTAALQSIAQQMGMTFSPMPGDDNLLPPKGLGLMAKRYGRPRNLLLGEWAGVKVRLFDLAAGRPKSTSEQTVAYFPDSVPGLRDFPADWLGLTTSAAYTAIVTEFNEFSIEAKEGRLIVYRWHHRVRPESYPAFLVVAGQVYQRLAALAKTSTDI
jgi:hypothetical protein